MRYRYSWLFLLTITLLIVGFIFSLQVNGRKEYLGSLENQSREDLFTLWRSLGDQKMKLQNDLYNTQMEYNILYQQTSEGKVSIESFVKELENTQLINGDLPATGNGIQIIFAGDSKLIATELVDIINELWNSGAEAITVNDQRITSRTNIDYILFEGEYTLTLNEEVVTYPVTIRAIGDYNNLYTGLTFKGGIIDILNSYEITPVITKTDKMVLSASNDYEYYKAVEGAN